MQVAKGFYEMNEAGLRDYGIDFQKGLAQFVGNRAIYEEYLAQFPDDEHFKDALEAFDRNDMDGTLRQIHALKGLASTLGFTELFEVCSGAVAWLRDVSPDKDINEFISMLSNMQEIYEKTKEGCRL
jgi:hypothetical protein